MSLSKVLSGAVVGLDAQLVEVEVDIGAGLPQFLIVGLPDKAVEEAKERVRSAIKNSGSKPPDRRTTVNLAPADLPKIGPAYDLPIAIGILSATEQVPPPDQKSLFLGELALDGRLRHTHGILPIMLESQKRGIKKVFIPQGDSQEASLVSDIEIFPIKTLTELIYFLKNEKRIKPIKTKVLNNIYTPPNETSFDMADIKGQEQAKRALEIAAAGAHNILLAGPPGSGKTLLAKALPGILPKLLFDEILEVTKIYSVASMLPADSPLILERPFRSPHHTSSNIALIGGGQSPHPGEITLAHRGVLFMDELPEFGRAVLEALRQPLEDRIVTVSRAAGSTSFPAHFSLVAAMNPCPCGYLNDPIRQCICSPTQIIRYQKKISGPLLDRIDLHIDVPRVKYEKLTDERIAETSNKIRRRVENARKIQSKRFKGQKIKTNSEMSIPHLKKYCFLDDTSKNILKSAVVQLNLSARAYHRILKLSRTIADLSCEEKIKASHIAEAIQYRPKEQIY